VKNCAKRHGVSFKAIGMPLRMALTGRKETPDISVIAQLLGREETFRRLRACGIASSQTD
jgi:glutamyl-tRNA synthetase